ncbi:MAG TPA: hypothetical protein VJJ54_06745 [Gemmatimonadales bacterium]|nr:hypothetical protein [Gemmatimonadales bacterium]
MSFDRGKRRCGAALTALVGVCVATGASAGQSVHDSTAARAPDRLFEATEPLELTLQADFGAINKNRGNDKPNHPGVLSYTTAARDSVALDVQLHTRGHFRLDRCQYPPLKIVFNREQTAHTTFAHQGSLKLAVQCRGGQSWGNYLLEEYLIYRAYNLLTDRSFHVRLARVTYVDPTGKHAPEVRRAFFVEDDDRMARRNAAHVFEQKGVFQTDVDFEQMGLAAVFQYMIGNTDFAVSALHNIVLIRDSVEVVYPVPYDFDWSGVIWTPYAQPDARLEIRDVRQRVFRGTCRSPQELATLFDRFNAQKDAIYELYRDMAAEGLEAKRIEQAIDYYDAFYKTINDPGRARREFILACRRN